MHPSEQHVTTLLWYNAALRSFLDEHKSILARGIFPLGTCVLLAHVCVSVRSSVGLLFLYTGL